MFTQCIYRTEQDDCQIITWDNKSGENNSKGLFRYKFYICWYE